MAKLFDLAHTWIMHQQQADQKAKKDAAGRLSHHLNRAGFGPPITPKGITP